MMFLASRGFRAVAHDRRGQGRSGQPWGGNDMDTYADDLAMLIGTLDLTDVILAGHSTGGGEVARYIGRHGTGRVAKVALVAAAVPLLVKTESNPGGFPIEEYNQLRLSVLRDLAEFFRQHAAPFFGAGSPGSEVSQGLRDWFFLQAMQASLKGTYDCIKAFSETDTTHQAASSLRYPSNCVSERNHLRFAHVCGQNMHGIAPVQRTMSST
jgi:non-heme chloroperoxidase